MAPLTTRPSHGEVHVVVVADGDVPDRAALDRAWPGWDADASAVIAADGGLLRAERLGLRPARLVGDLDSLPARDLARAIAAGIPVDRARPDKDESDSELGLLAAIAVGATRITLLGAFGGRLDHALANLGLLAHPALAACSLAFLDAGARVTLITAPGPDGAFVHRSLAGPVGATLSLLPFGGDVTGITTRGLRYPLRDEALTVGPARGLSNVREAPDAGVTVGGGRLLVVEVAPGPA
jgi:thiamine pyrophosphokinase